jgi:prophage antirepressor-like protein
MNDSTLDLIYKGGSESRAVRVVTIEGEPWFIAADVALILGYESTNHATRLLRGHQKGAHKVSTLGGQQSLSVINESGLYALIMKSRRAEAEAFQDWVTGEVLPKIRKNGGYAVVAPTPQTPTTSAVLLQTVQLLVQLEQRQERTENRTDALETAIHRIPILGEQVGIIHKLGQELGQTMGNYRKAWTLFNSHFEIASYRDLPASRFDEAKRFLQLQIAAYSGQDRLVDA